LKLPDQESFYLLVGRSPKSFGQCPRDHFSLRLGTRTISIRGQAAQDVSSFAVVADTCRREHPAYPRYCLRTEFHEPGIDFIFLGPIPGGYVGNYLRIQINLHGDAGGKTDQP